MKEKDNIDKLILQNLEELNNNEPMDGHFARFEAKLKKQQKKKPLITLNVVWKVAAVIVFALLASNQAFMYFSADNKGMFATKDASQEITLASLSTEYEEVEFYYTSAINTGMSQWNKLNAEGLITAEEQEMMTEELSEFESLYKNLQDDLKTNPDDDRVINAMLEYYQAKLSVINIIVDKLEEVKQRKNINYENI